MDLSRRQQQVLDTLRHREARGDPPPTLDELCAELGLASRGSLHKHIQALVTAELVEPMNGRQRGVRLCAANGETHRVPLLGDIAAGSPLDTFEPDENLDVPAGFRTSAPCFAVRVRGESMIEEGILDGDFVVAERRDSARVGELVVALIDGSEVTLKRLAASAELVRLEPANRAMHAQEYAAERVTIQGVVVSQLRRY